MLNKLRLAFQTITYLKRVQLVYQVFYKLRNRWIKPQKFGNLRGYKEPCGLLLHECHFVPESCEVTFSAEKKLKFTFLNLSKDFSNTSIDWNFQEHGKLWNYNQNYFEFLFSKNLSKSHGIGLIRDFCESYNTHNSALEPYPISLRGINWIKYFSLHKIHEGDFNESLYHQYKILTSSLEYHLLANHLLENGFSLLFAAYYFQNLEFYTQSTKILYSQLNEQIFNDGGHYERSPMYHQIILYRLLDCINLIRNNHWTQEVALMDFLMGKARSMLSWLKHLTFSNGEIPMVKDAAYGIAPSSSVLYSYADALGIKYSGNYPLSDSGYRVLNSNEFELVFDVGGISPSYQPGHAHADLLNIVLYHKSKPVIIDTAVSTYNICKRRSLERSTEAHNTIFVNGDSSIGIWSGFRVARRAEINVLEDSETFVKAQHDGYKNYGIQVKRSVESIDKHLIIKDYLDCSSNEPSEITLNLHFHPDCSVELEGNCVRIKDIDLVLTGYHNITMESYLFAAGFNSLREATRLCLKPTKNSQILIKNVD